MLKKVLVFLSKGDLKETLPLVFLASLLICGMIVFATPAQAYFVRGDANCDGSVDSTDAAYIIAFLFSGGPPPPCMDAADLNDNGTIALIDAVYLVDFLYSGGSPPFPPYPLCGTDPTTDGLGCLSECCPNHFKAYSIGPKQFTTNVFSRDQFMQDNLFLTGPVLLANPVQKDTFPVTDIKDHLHWYFAEGRDTLINLSYKNQYESVGVEIDSVRWLLVPTQKQPHLPPESLSHYKCYRIRQQQWIQRQPFMQDQFVPEGADSLRRELFCAPCQKNTFFPYDTLTHYVGYLIGPGNPLIPPMIRQTADQFATWIDTVLGSKYLLVPTAKFLPPPPPDTGKNHYKTWRLQPKPFTGVAAVTDQFMTDNLAYSQIEFLSNPVRKVVPGQVVPPDTFDIVDPDYHLVWYRAQGRDTLLEVEYVNQFESTAVKIDSVRYLLLPAQKIAPIFHNKPDSLDHYKAYRIRDPRTVNFLLGPVELEDQFDRMMGIVEPIDSLIPRLFLNPARKFTEPVYDTTTHYVAYEIFPKRTIGIQAITIDQFQPPPEDSLVVLFSDMLLVPTRKLDFGIPQADTGPNHFKTWRIQPVPFTVTVALEDQFMKDDNVRLDSIKYLSNPVRKIVFDPLGIPDTFNITDPNEHLNWYKAVGKKTYLKLAYQNQFESTTVLIDSLKYLLVPCQKSPHPAPDSLDHYKCYRICNPVLFNKAVLLDDQFDLTQEQVTSLSATYFCTPVRKNAEQMYDTVTHYVAYSFAPGSTTNEVRTTVDQFGAHPAQALFSEYLLVPTDKTGVLCDAIPGDANANLGLSLADVISIKNYIFGTAGCLPLPLCWLSGKICRGDTDGNGVVTLADVIRLVNYIFAKPCPTGVPGTTPCCWKPLPSPGSTCCLPVPGCDPGCP